MADVGATGVENAHQIAIGNAACRRVSGVDFQLRPAFDVAQGFDVHEGGVQEVARRWRNHCQRVALTLHFIVAQVVWKRVDAHFLQRWAVKLALARGGGKAALCKRRIGQRLLRKAVLQQLCKVDAAALQGLAAQVFVTVVKVGGGKGCVVARHVGGQFTKDLGVALGLPHRSNRRLVEQHVGVAVAGVDVPMLQLCGGGQHIVRVVGGVGQKVFQHHGKQVFAGKACGHLG